MPRACIAAGLNSAGPQAALSFCVGCKVYPLHSGTCNPHKRRGVRQLLGSARARILPDTPLLQNGVHVSMLGGNAENRMVFAAAVLMLQVEPNKASLRVALEDNAARRQSQRPAGCVQLAAITSQQQKQHHGNAAIDSNSVSCGTADAGLKKQPAGMFKSCWCACQSDWR